MKIHYRDLWAAIPGFEGIEAVGKALRENVEIDAAGTLPPCPAPLMVRRRLTSLGKLVITALDAVRIQQDEPFVFASAWADTQKSRCLVQEMVETGDVSPAGFTLSVHNATAGAATIWLSNHEPASAVSAGNLTTEAGLTEAFLQLQTHESVVFVRAEAPLPADWDAPAHRVAAPDFPYVWAMRLTRNNADAAFELEAVRSKDIRTLETPQMPEELAFFSGDAPVLHHAQGERGWVWIK